MRFDGKVVVITGGASGIGLAAARRFHREGAKVVIADLKDELGAAAVRELGPDRALYKHADVAAWPDVEALMRRAAEAFGGLDVLFNNAGVGSFATTPDLSVDDWRRVIDIDLSGVFYGCKAAIPLMRERGGGTIVNTASISGLRGDFGFAAYNAAKGAVINYTRAAAIDHAREGIRINAVCPAMVDTPMANNALSPEAAAIYKAASPIGRFATPEEVAAAAIWLCQDESRFITGQAIAVDGGWTAR